MPNRLEWEDVQVRYKEAMQSFIAAKEKPAEVVEAVKDIPVITISDDNEAAAAAAVVVTAESSAENVDDDDDKNDSVKKSEEDEKKLKQMDDVVAVDVGEKQEEAAVVVNPDSSITDKALTDNMKTEVFKFNFTTHTKLSFLSLSPS